MCEDTQKKASSTEIAVPLLGLAENHRMPLTTIQDKHMWEEVTQKNSKSYLYTSYNVPLKLPCICNQHSKKSHLIHLKHNLTLTIQRIYSVII
mmetsp:Transcript_28229/g.51758  ORF Transcript_28229/g.51758 Transcript_28229/m.51758 type:complete len:93 (-) Transcript_28229:1615-1893(-)